MNRPADVNLDLGKNADANIPIYKAAKVEYAKFL
jgi:hypothetical protein